MMKWIRITQLIAGRSSQEQDALITAAVLVKKLIMDLE